MQGIEIPIGAPLGQLDRDLKGAEKKLKGFTSSAETDLKGFSSTASSAFKTAGLALAGAFSVGAFVSFGKEVLAVTAEFEKFKAMYSKEYLIVPQVPFATTVKKVAGVIDVVLINKEGHLKFIDLKM